jgi:hypothetical protein
MHVSVGVVCPICRVPSESEVSTCRVCGRRLPGSRSGPSAKSVALLAVLSPLVLLVCAVSAGCYYVNSALVRSEVLKNSLSIASASPELQNILGADIHPISRAFGHLEKFEGAEFAEWSVPLSGTRGRGNLYGIANQVNGVWDYTRLVFQSADGRERVDLTPVHPLSLPKVPAKRVYLVPVGLTESLDWAPSYYKSKLGIEVTVLPG